MIPGARGVLAAVATAAAVVSTAAPAAPSSAAEPGRRATVVERAIFTGTFVGSPDIVVEGGARVRTYRVAVGEVFGPVDVTTERVRVRSTAALENCPATGGGRGGQAGGGAQSGGGAAGQGPAGGTDPDGQEQPGPDAPTTQEPGGVPPSEPVTDRRPRLFNAVVEEGAYVVASCNGVAIASATVLTSTEQRYGEGRPAGRPVPPEPDPLDEVSYLCPDTRDAVTDLDDPTACATLDDGQSFNRMAAPGLALVIVGALGLLLARRVGRRR